MPKISPSVGELLHICSIYDSKLLLTACGVFCFIKDFVCYVDSLWDILMLPSAADWWYISHYCSLIERWQKLGIGTVWYHGRRTLYLELQAMSFPHNICALDLHIIDILPLPTLQGQSVNRTNSSGTLTIFLLLTRYYDIDMTYIIIMMYIIPFTFAVRLGDFLW